MMHERARALILLSIADGKQAPLKELADLIGVPSPQAANHHLAVLASQGLIERGAVRKLTKAGQIAAGYLTALQRGDCIFRKLMGRWFGAYSVAAAQAVERIAEEQDGVYAVTREGLHRRRADGSRELERKVTSGALLAALKNHTTMDAAAAEVGIESAAFRVRASRIFRAAYIEVAQRVQAG